MGEVVVHFFVQFFCLGLRLVRGLHFIKASPAAGYICWMLTIALQGTGSRATTVRTQILLPSARHLEEGRGTTILELPRLENCISRLCVP